MNGRFPAKPQNLSRYVINHFFFTLGVSMHRPFFGFFGFWGGGRFLTLFCPFRGGGVFSSNFGFFALISRPGGFPGGLAPGPTAGGIPGGFCARRFDRRSNCVHGVSVSPPPSGTGSPRGLTSRSSPAPSSHGSFPGCRRGENKDPKSSTGAVRRRLQRTKQEQKELFG